MRESSRLLTGAITGLGQIGFSFNADRRRKGVWSHERAFAASGAVQLVAACDPVPARRAAFKKARPEVPVYESLDELLRRHKPEIVSICSPTRHHAELACRAATSGAKAVFCEKPIAATTKEAADLVALCRRERVALAVNHTRRWDPGYVRAAGLVKAGRIGRVTSIASRYSGHVYNIGTHLLDAARMLSGLAPALACGFSPEPGAEDPHVSGAVVFQGGAAMTLACHGRREDLIFELDLVGTEGRLRVVDNGATTLLEVFQPSKNASGYRELASERLGSVKREDRFVCAVKDLVSCIGTRRRPACSGEDGYYALAAAEALVNSARAGGVPYPVSVI